MVSETGVSPEFQQIVQELQSNTAYRELNLSYKRNMTSYDINIISESLKLNTTATELIPSGCGLMNNHFQLLAEVLKHNKILIRLSLSNNESTNMLDRTNISDKGIITIADALSVNHTLQHFSMTNNKLSGTIKTRIDENWKHNHRNNFDYIHL